MPVETAPTATDATDATVGYTLRRVGVIMTPDLNNPDEVDGVLNPATGRDSGGDLYLLPRLVASGNVSRVGLARVLVTDGVPPGWNASVWCSGPTPVGNGEQVTPGSRTHG